MQLLDKKQYLVKDASSLLPFQGIVSNEEAVSISSLWRKVKPSATLLVLCQLNESWRDCCRLTSSSNILQLLLPIRSPYWSPKLLIPLHIGLYVTIAVFCSLAILCPCVWCASFLHTQKKYFGEWNHPAESWDVLMTSVLIKLSFYFLGSQTYVKSTKTAVCTVMWNREAYGLSGKICMLCQFCFQLCVHHTTCLVGWFWSLWWTVRCSPRWLLLWESGLISCPMGVRL